MPWEPGFISPVTALYGRILSSCSRPCPGPPQLGPDSLFWWYSRRSRSLTLGTKRLSGRSRADLIPLTHWEIFLLLPSNLNIPSRTIFFHRKHLQTLVLPNSADHIPRCILPSLYTHPQNQVQCLQKVCSLPCFVPPLSSGHSRRWVCCWLLAGACHFLFTFCAFPSCHPQTLCLPSGLRQIFPRLIRAISSLIFSAP